MTTSVQNLRKIFTEQGVKGFGKASRADFDSAIGAAEVAAYAAVAVAKIPSDKICNICVTRRRMTSAQATREGIRTVDFGDMCIPCYRESGWENTHSDGGHDEINRTVATRALTLKELDEIDGCWICFPELNEAKAEYVFRAGSSKAGMVVHAKGSIEDKIATVRKAAEARGFKVVTGKSEGRTVLEADGGEDGPDLYLSLAWDNAGRYDYPFSLAIVAGKTRKVRNLAEALRFIG